MASVRAQPLILRLLGRSKTLGQQIDSHIRALEKQIEKLKKTEPKQPSVKPKQPSVANIFIV